jgi:hypothetical protein
MGADGGSYQMWLREVRVVHRLVLIGTCAAFRAIILDCRRVGQGILEYLDLFGKCPGLFTTDIKRIQHLPARLSS